MVSVQVRKRKVEKHVLCRKVRSEKSKNLHLHTNINFPKFYFRYRFIASLNDLLAMIMIMGPPLTQVLKP